MYKLKNKVLISIVTMLLIVFGCCFVNKSDSKVLANDTESISSEMLSALSVKCQVKENTDGSADLRIVSTVDALKTYGTAGFDIYVEVEEDGEKELELLHKYEKSYVTDKIGAKEDGVSFEYNPKVFDTISNYFITVTITGIPESDFGYGFLIKPFVTMSGSPNNYLYGQSRFVKVNDALNGGEYLSVPVAKLDDTTGYSVKVGDTTYSSDAIEFYNNETYDANYTHVRVKADPSELQSITNVSVMNGETEVTATTYRNLYSTLSTADTTWYDNTDGNEYVLATKADLLGLEKIVNNSTTEPYSAEQFSGKTIYLGADLVVNDTTAVNSPDTVEGWNGYTPQITWTPIGNSTKKFSGTFNGMNQSISGIYISRSDSNVGLFGVTVANTTVENLTLRNSYIKGYSAVGSVVGEGGGTFTNVHSNAVVISDNQNAGGVLGYRSTAIITLMKKCSYFGEVSTTGQYNNVGGFVGLLGGKNAKFTFEDCEFMGSVYTSGSQIGGFIGGVGGASEIEITGCTSNGSVTADDSKAGGYIGTIANATKVTISSSSSNATVEALGNQAGGFIGYAKKPAALDKIQFSGKVTGLQQVGGFVGAVEKTTFSVTDGLMSGTVEATRDTENEARNAGGLCGIVLEGTTTAKGTVNATRCLITGKIVYVADNNARCGEQVGQVQANNTYNAKGVYARTGCCENENFCGSVATDCWGDNLNNGRFTEKELTGENALQKVTGLEIDTAADGTSTWVATKNSYPTLRIFANENDILIQ